MNKFLSTAIGIGFAAAAIATPSYARPSLNHQQSAVEVHYADLNTASPAGSQILLQRIKNAASHVCGGRPDIRNLRARQNYHACMKDTVANAVASANIPALAAIHAQTGEAEVAHR